MYGVLLDIVYSTFTTQDTHRYNDMVKRVISGWDQQYVLDRVVDSYVLAECEIESPFYVKDKVISVTVQFPSCLTGSAPYTTGGGKLNVIDNNLVESGVEEFKVAINVPCDLSTNMPAWEIEVIGAGTAESTYSSQVS